MKKRYFVPACLLAVAGIGFIVCALGYPELSFPWSAQTAHILCGLYVDAVVLLFVLAFWKKASPSNILTLLLELGAIFFLVQSALTVFMAGKPNWYLPMALCLNCVALLLNTTRPRRDQKDM